jgi:hypothetical protein
MPVSARRFLLFICVGTPGANDISLEMMASLVREQGRVRVYRADIDGLRACSELGAMISEPALEAIWDGKVTSNHE